MPSHSSKQSNTSSKRNGPKPPRKLHRLIHTRLGPPGLPALCGSVLRIHWHVRRVQAVLGCKGARIVIYLFIYIYIRLVCVEHKINNVTVVVCTWNIRIQWDCAELFLWIKPLLPFGKHKLICLRVFALINSHAYFSLSSAVAGSRLQVLQLSRLSLANFVECWFRCLFIGFGEMKT